LSLLSASQVWEKANPGVRLQTIIQLALHAVNRNQPDLLRIEPDGAGNIANRDISPYFQCLSPGLSGEQLCKDLNVKCHGFFL
jgi:hypothetical protein